MAVLDDSVLSGADSNIEVLRPAGRRTITHAFHDVDGTHSLIRDWPPVMSLSIHWAMTSGLGEDFDSDRNLAALIRRVGKRKLPETGSSSRASCSTKSNSTFEMERVPWPAGPAT